jgi:hypothetical protein
MKADTLSKLTITKGDTSLALKFAFAAATGISRREDVEEWDAIPASLSTFDKKNVNKNTSLTSIEVFVDDDTIISNQSWFVSFFKTTALFLCDYSFAGIYIR